MSLNRKLMEMYTEQTGESAIYKKGSLTMHTLRYVDWLEALATSKPADSAAVALLGKMFNDPNQFFRPEYVHEIALLITQPPCPSGSGNTRKPDPAPKESPAQIKRDCSNCKRRFRWWFFGWRNGCWAGFPSCTRSGFANDEWRPA